MDTKAIVSQFDIFIYVKRKEKKHTHTQLQRRRKGACRLSDEGHVLGALLIIHPHACQESTLSHIHKKIQLGQVPSSHSDNVDSTPPCTHTMYPQCTNYKNIGGFSLGEW